MPCTRSTACKVSQMESRLSVPGDGCRYPTEVRDCPMTTRHRILLATGFVSLVFAALPWLGFGCCDFAAPGIDMLVPRLSILNETTVPFGRLLYGVMETPLQMLGLIPPIGDVVFYSGEGVVRVRPFMIFVFWLIVGMLAVWVAIRPTVMPSYYGHLRHNPNPANGG